MTGAAEMQKWEYLFVICGVPASELKESQDRVSADPDLKDLHPLALDPLLLPHARPRVVNRQALPDWESGPPISRYANRLGEEGWESNLAT